MVNAKSFLFLATLSLLSFRVAAQQNADSIHSAPAVSLHYNGQISGWMQYAPDISSNFWLGGRYIPQLNLNIPLKNNHLKQSSEPPAGGRLIDFEFSANILGDMGVHLGNQAAFDWRIKPYRAWARYSAERVEVRLGLQKINFGSAALFRPLMWFDQLDPRDPLQLTDGVWGLLGRYYFQNNTNIWLWGLWGNNRRKGWEMLSTARHIPETGGRIQFPVPRGETALSYHFRKVDPLLPGSSATEEENPALSENRWGFDTRLDVTVGLWLEASWTRIDKSLGMFANQEMITLGADYTWGIGNGLMTTFEQLVFSYDRTAFRFANSISFSGLSLSYPVGLFDHLNAITYYDWTNRNAYFFLNWQKSFDHLTFYLMGYWNPKNYSLPGQSMAGERFAGKGLQFMAVWNY